MAEETQKQKTKNDNLLHIRLGDKTAEEVAEFATKVYGFKNTSEYVRHVLDFIEENRPVLGKSFAPGDATT